MTPSIWSWAWNWSPNRTLEKTGHVTLPVAGPGTNPADSVGKLPCTASQKKGNIQEYWK